MSSQEKQKAISIEGDRTRHNKGDIITRCRYFVHDVMAELEKCQWPNRSELIETTLLVLVFVFALAFFIFATDQGYQFIFRNCLRIS